jgi:hypothetical protein
MAVFAEEVSETYRAGLEGRPTQLPELRVQYSDYVAWEKKWLRGANLARLEDFWRQQLRDVPMLNVPTDHPRPARVRFEGNFLGRPAPASLFQAISTLARRHKATPFMVFAAATAELIHRLSGQDDFVIGTPCENRNLAGAELLVGCFVNVVPLRIDRSGDPTFLEFLLRVRKSLLTSYDYQSLPINRIIEAVGAKREPNRLPLIQFSCEMQLQEWLPLELTGCSFDYDLVTHGTARYEMAFHALAKPEHLWLALELNTSLWDETTGDRLLGALEAGLAEVVEDPTRKLSTYRFQGEG